MSGPSSHTTPSHARSAAMACSNSRRARAASVYSKRRTNVPPVRRATRWLNSAVRAPPRCRGPDGDGEKRTRSPTSLAPLEQDDRLRRGSFAPPGQTEALRGRRLHADALDIDTDGGRDPSAHLLAEGRDLRRLHDEHRVGVEQPPSSFTHEPGDALQKPDRGGAGIRGVNVREVLADVPLAHRSQDGIHQCVDEHVGIRMAQQPAIGRHLDSADHELPAVGERVHVIAQTDTELAHARSSSPRRASSTPSTVRSSGTVTLRFQRGPSIMRTVPPSRSTSEASSVPSKPSASARCLLYTSPSP